MRQINNIFDIQQSIKDIQDQSKKIAISAVQPELSTVNPGKFFIANENGSNNAIAGGVPVSVAPGIVVLVLLKHTLVAGVNTFNNSPIKSHRNPANNIAVAYAIGSIIQLVWDGTNWQDLSQ